MKDSRKERSKSQTAFQRFYDLGERSAKVDYEAIRKKSINLRCLVGF